jgi:hypothetical protein
LLIWKCKEISIGKYVKSSNLDKIIVFDNGTGWRLAIGITHASRMNKIHGERVSNKLELTLSSGITIFRDGSIGIPDNQIQLSL